MVRDQQLAQAFEFLCLLYQGIKGINLLSGRELLIRPIGQTVYLMPPYLIDEPAAKFLAAAVAATLEEVVHAA